jgi:sugar-specific transcriptional regulator TrmB
MGREVMEIITEDIETLTWLGLTERQARVYLALLQIGSSGAEAISRFS